jgi:Na+-driven multidrug efflux pump
VKHALISQWTPSCLRLGLLPIHLESVSGLSECKLTLQIEHKLTTRAVVMTVSMIPMFVLWWNVEGILLKLGQGWSLAYSLQPELIRVEAQVAHLAANYLRWLSIGIPGYGGTVLIKK